LTSACGGRRAAQTLAVVCLHGRRGNHRYAFSSIGVHEAVRAAGLPFAVAAVDGGEASYWHGPRRDGTDAGRLVREEFVPLVRERVGRPDLPVALLGWSMGGYGALLAAAREPDRFAGVAAASSALWLRPGDSAAGAFDDAEDSERHDVFELTAELASVPIRIDCGDADPFASSNRALRERLPDATGGFRAGGHDKGYWRRVLPDQLRDMARWVA